MASDPGRPGVRWHFKGAKRYIGRQEKTKAHQIIDFVPAQGLRAGVFRTVAASKGARWAGPQSRSIQDGGQRPAKVEYFSSLTESGAMSCAGAGSADATMRAASHIGPHAPTTSTSGANRGPGFKRPRGLLAANSREVDNDFAAKGGCRMLNGRRPHMPVVRSESFPIFGARVETPRRI